MRRINTAGLNLLKKCEGYSSTAYKDVRGLWTIGYGHRNPCLAAKSAITALAAETLLEQDLDTAEQSVDTIIAPLTDNQFSALVCFVFNIGITAFNTSTMRRYIEELRYTDAADQFLRWNHITTSDGVETNRSLTARRAAERALFLER